MNLFPYPITKILIPYDGSPSARNALELAARLSLAGKDAVIGVTLLQVTGGSYLARHIQNVDLRVTRMDQDKDWQRIRQRYLEQEVLPLLADGEKMLLSLGVKAPIAVRVAEGKVGEEIIRLARQEAFSTIIMGRRGLSPLKALLLGSVTRSVLSLAEKVTVYVAAQEPPPTGQPVFPILLPVDGSEYSLAAVRQAAALAQACGAPKPCLTLLHVVDIALLGMHLQESGQDLVQEGERILALSRGILQEAGLEEGGWQEKLVSGPPAQTIVQHAEAGNHPLIMMGSRGHSAWATLLLGSVTSTVVHTASRATVAVVYA